MWRTFALFEHYGRMTLTLDEIAEQVGLAPGTIKNRRARGEFPWIRDEGRPLIEAPRQACRRGFSFG